MSCTNYVSLSSSLPTSLQTITDHRKLSCNYSDDAYTLSDQAIAVRLLWPSLERLLDCLDVFFPFAWLTRAASPMMPTSKILVQSLHPARLVSASLSSNVLYLLHIIKKKTTASAYELLDIRHFCRQPAAYMPMSTSL